uniref:Uncharacterized protein n=1 Tax=Aureoumbra lagunensis TaxID=44058 RepID=A0A7S3NJI1_9STRA|mmetsp:Transcript_15459/g.23283  ORF Transcript_15459/g.23283 Transcript_15459/m.23283 type:complete len:180 (-) Transcript_15459:205-744(-)
MDNDDPYSYDEYNDDAYIDDSTSKSNKKKSSDQAEIIIVVVIVALIGFVIIMIMLRKFKRVPQHEQYHEFERRRSPEQIVVDSGSNDIVASETELVPLEAESSALPELSDEAPKVQLNIRRKSQEPRGRPPETDDPTSPLHNARNRQHATGLGAIFEEAEDSEEIGNEGREGGGNTNMV